MNPSDTWKKGLAVGAQFFAVGLLVVVMLILTSEETGNPVTPAMSAVHKNFLIILFLAFVVWVVGMIAAYCIQQSQLIIWGMGVADVVILMLAVIQQGGLSKSVFVPMFFLIPTVLILLEHDNLKQMYRGKASLCIALIIVPIGAALHQAYTVSMEGMTQYNFLYVYNVNVVNISQVIGWRPLENALFLVSLFSLLVPVAEILMVRMRGSQDETVDT